MNSISIRHQLLKVANFLQSENTKIFQDKFSDRNPEEVKALADRSYFIFGIWKDYDGYRNLLASISDWPQMENFVKKCEEKISSLSVLISRFGFPPNVAEDMSRQYLHKYLKELDSGEFLDRVSSAGNKADFIALLRGEKKKKTSLIPELEGKNLSDLNPDHIDWITKIIQSSKDGGEAHSVDDIISLTKTFRRMEQNYNKKIGEFNTYSELSKFIDDQSFENKSAYISSIKDAANSNDMSRVIHEDSRWKVVLIGSTIGGQWWGRDTSFCISSLEDNLYSTYALNQNTDPYFIIDKLAQSSDKMRKFTLAIEYKNGKPTLSKNPATMTNADNVGISFDDIKNYLGQDANLIIRKIEDDAATRSYSIGSENYKKIKTFIEEHDDEQIIRYGKEIIANDQLSQSLFNKIKDKFEEEKYQKFINYIIKEKPSVLVNYLNKNKSSYLAKYGSDLGQSLATSDPRSFFENYDFFYWDNFLNLAFQNLLKKDDVNLTGFLRIHRYDQWMSEDYLNLILNKIISNPKEAISFVDTFLGTKWAEPYLGEAMKVAIKENPEEVLKGNFKKASLNKYMEEAAESMAQKNVGWFISYLSNKKSVPFWAEPYLNESAKVMAEVDPLALLTAVRNIDLVSYRVEVDPIILAAKNLKEKEYEKFSDFAKENDWVFDLINWKSDDSNVTVASKKKHYTKLLKLAKLIDDLGLREGEKILNLIRE